jgi:hypothetical protein
MRTQLLAAVLCSIAFLAKAQGDGWPPPRLNSDTLDWWTPVSSPLILAALAAAVVAIVGIVLLIRVLSNKREEPRAR